MTPERWRLVKAVLADAMALAPGEREAWLTKRCGDDRSLYEEVMSLLEHDRGDDFLDHPLVASSAVSEDDEAPTSLGERYRIVRTIGAGGMGTVFEAVDDTLGRHVAVKMLPGRFAASRERRQRFARETRLIAGLSHAGICQVHDAGIHDDRPYLVMELVDGETLASRLERGPLAPADAVGCARQIADALSYAHRRGVIHRDLKPSNIMLTGEGVKLLDFGLAKALGDRGTVEPDAAATTPTVDSAVTASGAIVGTLHYMSPEQLEGRAVDARSDVFSLGVVIFEMLTGERPFRGESQASLVASILRDDAPRASGRNPLISPAFDAVVSSCLEKDPERRWQDAGDVARALGSSLAEAQPTTSVRQVPLTRWAGWSLAATCAAAVAWGAWSLVPTRARSDAPAMHLAITAPPELEGQYFGPSLSPDGRQIAFVSVRTGEQPRIWIRSLDAPTPRALTGTEGALRHFWSADSTQLAFFARGGLYRVGLTGASPVLICSTASGVWGGSWSQDGVILFSGGPGDGIYRVLPGSSAPTKMTVPQDDESAHLWPVFLPDGRTFLYTVASANPTVQGIYVATLDTPRGRRLNDAWSATAYAPEGYVLYARDQLLVAQRFDPERRVFEGRRRPGDGGALGLLFRCTRHDRVSVG
ncbi:MAG: protein kinase [Vicinamibacterales bacterium]